MPAPRVGSPGPVACAPSGPRHRPLQGQSRRPFGAQHRQKTRHGHVARRWGRPRRPMGKTDRRGRVAIPEHRGMRQHHRPKRRGDRPQDRPDRNAGCPRQAKGSRARGWHRRQAPPAGSAEDWFSAPRIVLARHRRACIDPVRPDAPPRKGEKPVLSAAGTFDMATLKQAIFRGPDHATTADQRAAGLGSVGHPDVPTQGSAGGHRRGGGGRAITVTILRRALDPPPPPPSARTRSPTWDIVMR